MDIFNEILGFEVDSVLAKSAVSKEMELAISPASPEDGHHGGGEMGGVELDEQRDITKVKKAAGASYEPKESSMSSGIPQKLAGQGFGTPAPVSGSSGFPGDGYPGDGAETMLSEDDVSVGQQMHGKVRPIEESAEVGQGEGSGDVSLGSNRKMLKGFGREEDVRFVPQAAYMRPQAQSVVGQSWQAGVVTYNTSLDEHIAKALEEQTLIAEPTLNWQAPLIKSHVCGNSLCKSSFPSFLTVCPNCHSGQSSQGVSFSKSVDASIKGPTQGDVRFVAGGIKLG